MLCALIMAGGSGQRFWPLSTSERPKQLLSLFSEKSMIRETVDRILDLIPAENIFIGTNIVQSKGIKEQLPMLADDNIIIEPAFKDTAAAVGYGASYIKELRGECELVVLAADHLISKKDDFLRVLEKGSNEARVNGSIVTLGIVPTTPETGYGYIQKSDVEMDGIYDVEGFREKPSLEKAKTYLKSGDYLWNSGMFIFSIKTVMNELKTYMPNHYHTLEKIIVEIEKGHKGEELSNATKAFFDDFERISIDFGVMEKSEIIKVIPCDIGWNDIGSFAAFEDVLDKNENGSIIQKASAKEINSKNNIVYLEEDEVALIGVEDLVVIKSEGKILISKKDCLQDIKKIF